eukprot:PhM_4_TR697/c0_g1_i1/m.4513
MFTRIRTKLVGGTINEADESHQQPTDADSNNNTNNGNNYSNDYLIASSSSTSKRDLDRILRAVESNDATLPELKLSGCTADVCTPSFMEALCTAIPEDRHVVSVDCSHMPFAGTVYATALAQMLTQNFTLTTLRLSYCHLADDSLRKLVGVLASNVALTELELSGNHLSDGDAVGTLLRHNQTLQSLNLACNNFGANVIGIWRQLPSNAALRRLDLTCNELEDESFAAVIDYLTSNATLDTISSLDNPNVLAATSKRVNILLQKGASRVLPRHSSNAAAAAAVGGIGSLPPSCSSALASSLSCHTISHSAAVATNTEESLLDLEEEHKALKAEVRQLKVDALHAERNAVQTTQRHDGVVQELEQQLSTVSAALELTKSELRDEKEKNKELNDVIVQLTTSLRSTTSALEAAQKQQQQQPQSHPQNDSDSVASSSCCTSARRDSDLSSVQITSPQSCAWMRNSDAKTCCLCEKAFTVTRRRHHCRRCGAIYCSKCCPISVIHDKQRICLGCVKD